MGGSNSIFNAFYLLASFVSPCLVTTLAEIKPTSNPLHGNLSVIPNEN